MAAASARALGHPCQGLLGAGQQLTRGCVQEELAARSSMHGGLIYALGFDQVIAQWHSCFAVVQRTPAASP